MKIFSKKFKKESENIVNSKIEENLLFHLQESVKWTKPRSKKNLYERMD